MVGKLLVIIPAYNEEGSIQKTVDHLIADHPQFDYVIINDGSKDHTLEICRRNHYNVVSQPVNLGLAGAFQTGMKYACKHGYDAAIQFDADGQHRPEYIESMFEKLQEGYDIVIGSRFVKEKKPKSLRMTGSNIIESLIHMTTGTVIHDPTSGMRMYGKRIIRLFANEVNFDPEPDTIAYLIRCGAKCAEVQVKMDERTAGQSYLTLSKSAQYMAVQCVSILLIGCFRKKAELGGVR